MRRFRPWRSRAASSSRRSSLHGADAGHDRAGRSPLDPPKVRFMELLEDLMGCGRCQGGHKEAWQCQLATGAAQGGIRWPTTRRGPRRWSYGSRRSLPPHRYPAQHQRRPSKWNLWKTTHLSWKSMTRRPPIRPRPNSPRRRRRRRRRNCTGGYR